MTTASAIVWETEDAALPRWRQFAGTGSPFLPFLPAYIVVFKISSMVRHLRELNWRRTLGNFWCLLFPKFRLLGCLSIKSGKSGNGWLGEDAWGCPICDSLPLTWLICAAMLCLYCYRATVFQNCLKRFLTQIYSYSLSHDRVHPSHTL